MPHLTHIFRHPIKAIGVEALDQVILAAGQTLPGDRLWAVAHEASDYQETQDWGHCANFVRGAGSSQLMAVRAHMEAEKITLTHPKSADLTIDPADAIDAARLIDWLRPLCDPKRAAPARLVRAGTRGMTDNRHAWVTIHNAASLTALEEKLGTDLARERFRGNLWIDGPDAWAEFEWTGRQLRIGDAIVEVTEPVERCTATMVNPKTGEPDAETLEALKTHWGHQNFGVFAMVTSGGPVAVGDAVDLIP